MAWSQCRKLGTRNNLWCDDSTSRLKTVTMHAVSMSFMRPTSHHAGPATRWWPSVLQLPSIAAVPLRPLHASAMQNFLNPAPDHIVFHATFLGSRPPRASPRCATGSAGAISLGPSALMVTADETSVSRRPFLRGHRPRPRVAGLHVHDRRPGPLGGHAAPLPRDSALEASRVKSNISAISGSTRLAR